MVIACPVSNRLKANRMLAVRNGRGPNADTDRGHACHSFRVSISTLRAPVGGMHARAVRVRSIGRGGLDESRQMSQRTFSRISIAVSATDRLL